MVVVSSLSQTRPWWYRAPAWEWYDTLKWQAIGLPTFIATWLFFAVLIFEFSWSTGMWIMTFVCGVLVLHALWLGAFCLVAVQLMRRDRRRGWHRQHWDKEWTA